MFRRVREFIAKDDYGILFNILVFANLKHRRNGTVRYRGHNRLVTELGELVCDEGAGLYTIAHSGRLLHKVRDPADK